MNNIVSTTFNGYKYNEYGVCVNPDIAYEWGKRMVCYFKISVSETPQGWTYGYNYEGTAYGGGGGRSLSDKDKYPSRSKAIVACAEMLKRQLSRDKSAAKAINELDHIIEAESTPKQPVKQYTIFDYL